MNRIKAFLLTVSFLSALSVSCTNKATVSDAQITTDIQSKLYSDASTRQANVAVAVKDGAVTLSGDVPSSEVELAAMKIANATNGVHGVSDQMKVNTASVAPPLDSDGSSASNLANAPATPQRSASRAVKRSETQYPPVTTPAQTSLSTPAQAPANTVANNSVPMTAPPPVAESTPVAETRPSVPETVTIPAGDRLSVRTIDAIDSGKVSEGQDLRASLEAPLTADGRVIVPAGAPVTLQVSSVQGARRIKGQSELSLRATSLQYRGRTVPLASSVYSEDGKARGKNTALKTGLGAAAGALIGGLAGGGKGAGIGAAAGGGAGFGYNAMTHGAQIKIPAETVLSFRLENALTVPVPRQQN